MKLKHGLIIVLLGLFNWSCQKEIILEEATTSVNENTDVLQRGNSHLTIAVVSDIHYMHPSLLINNGASGAAFQNYLAQDPKLLEYSDPIFRNVLMNLKAERPDILLVPGDLTKDGEKIGHLAMAGFLNQLRNCGTKVYVIPGNHDINNVKAQVFIGDKTYPVAMTSKADFERIYGNFGYRNAISRDPHSLSYVVQPGPDFRIIAIDASKYEEYGASGDVAAGRIKPETLNWVLAQLEQAKKHHITIFGMMHHNLIEHYAGQATLDPGYVVEDNINIANKMMDAGLKIIFTGHYHGNDISPYIHNGKELFDIETGSLVTTPSPFRIITMKDNSLTVSTKTVQTIKANLPGGLSFTAYSNIFLSQHLDGYFNYVLMNQFGAPADLANFAAPLFRNGIMAHFAGDEKMPPDQQSQIEMLATMAPPLADIVTTFWTDLGVRDNKSYINFK